MKKAEECENINEIRECIDQIDKSIIDKLFQRSSFVKEASKFKGSISEVKASERVKTMIQTRRIWAVEFGINPDFIQSLFELVVNFFIKGEMAHWQKENSKKSDLIIQDASKEDIKEILSLQKRAFLQEAELIGNFHIVPIVQTISEIEQEFPKYSVLKGCKDDRIIGSVRGNVIDNKCYIGRLIVEPVYQHQGYGSALMDAIESRFSHATAFELFTGESSENNIRFYSKRGYKTVQSFASPDGAKLVKMIKTK